MQGGGGWWGGGCFPVPVGARKITVTCSFSTDRAPEARVDSSISVCSGLQAVSLLSPVLYFSQKKTTSKGESCMCLAGSVHESHDEKHLDSTGQTLTLDCYKH